MELTKQLANAENVQLKGQISNYEKDGGFYPRMQEMRDEIATLREAVNNYKEDEHKTQVEFAKLQGENDTLRHIAHADDCQITSLNLELEQLKALLPDLDFKTYDYSKATRCKWSVLHHLSRECDLNATSIYRTPKQPSRPEYIPTEWIDISLIKLASKPIVCDVLLSEKWTPRKLHFFIMSHEGYPYVCNDGYQYKEIRIKVDEWERVTGKRYEQEVK